MHPVHPRSALLTFCVALTAVASGCGDDDDDSKGLVSAELGLRLTQPDCNGKAVREASYEIRGTVGGSATSVQVAGKRVATDEGTFTARVALRPGINLIRVAASGGGSMDSIPLVLVRTSRPTPAQRPADGTTLCTPQLPEVVERARQDPTFGSGSSEDIEIPNAPPRQVAESRPTEVVGGPLFFRASVREFDGEKDVTAVRYVLVWKLNRDPFIRSPGENSNYGRGTYEVENYPMNDQGGVDKIPQAGGRFCFVSYIDQDEFEGARIFEKLDEDDPVRVELAPTRTKRKFVFETPLLRGGLDLADADSKRALARIGCGPPDSIN